MSALARALGLSVLFMAVRSLYTDDHEAFRDSFATFVQKELAPNYLYWEEAGIAPAASSPRPAGTGSSEWLSPSSTAAVAPKTSASTL